MIKYLVRSNNQMYWHLREIEALFFFKFIKICAPIFLCPKLASNLKNSQYYPLPCWKLDHFVTKTCFSQFFQCPQHWLVYMNMSIVSSPLQDETFLAIAMILLNVTIISEVVYMIDTLHNIYNSVLIARRFYFETLFRFHYLFKIILFYSSIL